MLADMDGNLIFLLIMAVIGVINWLTNKKSEEGAKQKNPESKSAQPGTLRPQPAATSEEERMRKFLEALGIPAGQAPPPIKPRQAAPGPPPPLPRLEPKPPFVAAPPLVLRPKHRSAEPVPPPIPLREEPAKREQSAPKLSFEELRRESLETSQLPELVTTASMVTAIPNENPRPEERDAYSIAPEFSAQAPSDTLRALLASPASLRSAILLREVLGPPRGLQSTGSLPTFP